MPYYAVKEGKKTGIFTSWDECKKQVIGFKGAVYKKFPTKPEAEDYLSVEHIRVAKELSDLVEGEVIAYSDGSYDAKAGVYKYGVVLETKEGRFEFNGRDNHPALLKSNNVAGELVGATVAVSEAIAQGYKRVYLHYDYAGIEGWVVGGWVKDTEASRMYFDAMKNLMEYIDVKFIKVEGHSGDELNELADRLAGSA